MTAGPPHPAVRAVTPRWLLACAVALAWCAAVSTALLFALAGAVLDDPAAPRPVALMVLLALLAAGSAGGGAWLSQWAASHAERRLRSLIVSRVFDLGVARVAGRSGELLSLATAAAERVAGYRAGFLGPIAGALTTPLLVLAVMAITTDAVTAGWLALLIVLVPLIIGGFQRLVRPVGGAYRRTQARLTAAFLEAIQALETLVHARAAERTAAALARRGEEHRRGVMRVLAGSQLLILVVDAVFSLSVVVAASVIVSLRISAGELMAGEGIAIILMTLLVIGPVDLVGQFFYIGVAGRAAQRQISDHLSGPPDGAPGNGRDALSGADERGSRGRAGQKKPGARDGADETASAGRSGWAQPGTRGEAAVASDGQAGRVQPGARGVQPPGAIVFERVTGGWPGAAPVLRELSFRVEPGERVALAGPSGAGKSTVSALIQAHLNARSGWVSVDGIDVTAANGDEVRSRLAVVEQRTFLFLGTIAENLRVADPGASDARLREALAAAGLLDEVDAMPLGLGTQVGERGALLSGGQAQRLAIARAWLRDAPILILDEPTSQVDLASEALILAALDRLAQGRTVLMIAHRPGALLTADRVIALSEAQSVAGAQS